MMRRSSIPRLAASVCAALIFFTFCSETCAQSAMTSKNIVYTRYAGVDTMLTSFDVYWYD
jgi:hypothetical protein